MVDMKSLLTMQGMVFAMLLVGVCYLLHLEPLVAEVITVLVSMPVANTTALLASQHDCDYGFASGLVVFTTLVSMVTIPVYGMLVGIVFA